MNLIIINFNLRHERVYEKINVFFIDDAFRIVEKQRIV